MDTLVKTIQNFLATTGIAQLFENVNWWQTVIMFAISFVLIYFAIVKKFEPLLLLPIAIGMLLTNLPGSNMFHFEYFVQSEGAVATLTDVINSACADMMLSIEEYNAYTVTQHSVILFDT